MLGNYITFPELLLWIPLLTALVAFFIRDAKKVKVWALFSSIITLTISVISLCYTRNNSYNYVSYEWMPYLGCSFAVGLDGMGHMLTFLTALSFPLLLLGTYKNEYKNANAFYGLLLLSQFGLMGVFVATDALLFYFFWELALIPVYFLCSRWGGERRIPATFKFFIYTLTGSLFLLFGIIYLYQLTPGAHTTDFSVFNQLHIPANTQIRLFWILFVAFAIKMPVFPFHTWQPSTYSMASTQGVMILAGIMTKMGIYGALRFLFPIVPHGVEYWQNTVIILSLIGVIYASVIAFRQKNLKKLIAFSSMAHISLMVAAMFVMNYHALLGLLFQVISHGVTIVALFYMVNLIEERTGTLELPLMGGIKLRAPNMAILLLIVALSSIALPMTAGFVGEFLMIAGLFQQSAWFAVFGGMTMILGANFRNDICT